MLGGLLVINGDSERRFQGPGKAGDQRLAHSMGSQALKADPGGERPPAA